MSLLLGAIEDNHRVLTGDLDAALDDGFVHAAS